MKIPRLVEVDGILLPPIFDPETFRATCKFKPRKDNVFVVTYPKCGTTWTLQIVGLILRKGVPPADADEYFAIFPFMEMTTVEYLQNFRKDGCIKTHLPFNRITFSKEAKYIYVARHPADCMVSYYHHIKYFPTYFFNDGTFDDLFESFISGMIEFGDYFDHLISWYERRNEPNVFFTTFEALKDDPRRLILKMAEFLGEPYYQNLVEDDEKILKKVLEYSSFEYMHNAVNKYWEDVFTRPPSEEIQKQSPVWKKQAELLAEADEKGHHSVGNFIRRGKTGEGKIILSEDQKKRLENRIQEKCAHSDVMDLWKSH